MVGRQGAGAQDEKAYGSHDPEQDTAIAAGLQKSLIRYVANEC